MKKILCLILLNPFFLFAEVHITTLDNWNIENISEHDLFISKQGEISRSTFIGFKVARPFCVCTNPVFNLEIIDPLREGDIIPASITVDMGKKKLINFRVLSQPESSNMAFLKPLGFPSLRTSKVVEVESTFLSNELFFTSGIKNVMDNSKEMCESKFLLENTEKKDTAFEMEV